MRSAPQGTEAASADQAEAVGEGPARVASIRAALCKAAAGWWTIKFGCSHASKCGCPFALEFKHIGSGMVEVRQTETHQFHDPSSVADLAQLRMDPALEGVAAVLLRNGVKPQQVVTELNNQRSVPTTGSNGGSSSSGSLLAVYGNSRLTVTKEQIYALKKRLRREAGLGITDDTHAVAELVPALQHAGCLALYQPYKQASAGQGATPFIIALQTPFQQRMLNEFGRRIAFLDATGGTNKYGYMMYALVVSGGRHAAPLAQVQDSDCLRASAAGAG